MSPSLILSLATCTDMCSRPEAPTVCRAVHWGCKCVCVPVWGALHSCHARGSTLLAQLAVRIGRWTRLQQCPPFLAVGGWRGLLSANGDGEGLNTMQARSAVSWSLLQPGLPGRYGGTGPQKCLCLPKYCDLCRTTNAKMTKSYDAHYVKSIP